eukprot:Skav206738  [mRNA]  locus=scaffold2729:110557:114459:+ [translate_table: standard]
MAFPAPFVDEGPAISHVISLGCRCSQASVYRALQKRRYACPFDWIFSSPQMVTHCLQDDFRSFLDRAQLYDNGSSFDAIGLKPGSAPRERRFTGPGGSPGRWCLATPAMVGSWGPQVAIPRLNLNRQLWLEAEIHRLFEELQRRSRNFLLLAVDCSSKNLGAAAEASTVLQDVTAPGCRLVMCRVPCAGDNTGSYFRHDGDAQRVQALLVQPFTFRLSPDPLEGRPGVGPGAPSAGAQAAPAGPTPSAGAQAGQADFPAAHPGGDPTAGGQTAQAIGGQADDPAGDSQANSGYVQLPEPKAVVRRWGRAR